MSGLSRVQLRQLSAARKRPAHEFRGTLPNGLIEALLRFWRDNRGKNILADMMDQRARLGLPLDNAAYLSEEYSQIFLQGLAEGADPRCAESYTVPIDETLIRAIEETAGPFCKARLSGLMRGGQISEHIDDPKQTRSLAVIAGDHEFWIKPGREFERVPMRIGELWFINTAWPHKILNTFDTNRVALMINHVQV